MMQLMKYTAKIVAKQAKLPYSISRLTTDPEYNIKLGSYYFNELLNDYNGVFPFAIAAYNAGQIELKLGEELMETLLKVKFLILIGLNKLDLKKLEIMFKEF